MMFRNHGRGSMSTIVGWRITKPSQTPKRHKHEVDEPLKMHPWFWFAILILLQQAIENKGCSPTWPRGKYTLLKPKTGCPDGWDNEGYLYQDTIDKNPSNNRSETLHIHGEVASSHVKIYFCSKTCTGKKRAKDWASGQYCVYRHKDEKLTGMRAGSILMYGEKHNSKDEYKFTKFQVDIKKSKGSYEYTRLYYACRRTGNKKIPISLPITKPFYLLPHGSRDCQQVEWMVATSEWIKYHTNNYDTKSGKQSYGAVPYHELGDRKQKGITMYYCYYEKCNYTLNDTSGVFQSPGFPGKYPDGQLCSWTIVVPENHTLQVRFTNFSLSENDTLKYLKWIKVNFQSYTIPVSMVPFTLKADNHVLFVFRSDKSNNSFGFRAEYRVFMPQGSGMTTNASTPQPEVQDGKSSAETINDSPFDSKNKAIAVITIPVFCLLTGAVLVMIIYHYRIRARKSLAKNSKRDKEETDHSVMNSTYGSREEAVKTSGE